MGVKRKLYDLRAWYIWCFKRRCAGACNDLRRFTNCSSYPLFSLWCYVKRNTFIKKEACMKVIKLFWLGALIFFVSGFFYLGIIGIPVLQKMQIYYVQISLPK